MQELPGCMQQVVSLDTCPQPMGIGREMPQVHTCWSEAEQQSPWVLGRSLQDCALLAHHDSMVNLDCGLMLICTKENSIICPSLLLHHTLSFLFSWLQVTFQAYFLHPQPCHRLYFQRVPVRGAQELKSDRKCIGRSVVSDSLQPHGL